MDKEAAELYKKMKTSKGSSQNMVKTKLMMLLKKKKL